MKMTLPLLPIIPSPFRVEITKGEFILPSVVKLSCDPELSAAVLIDLASHHALRPLKISHSSSAQIQIRKKRLPTASYELHINTSRIIISASDAEGSRNGCITLFHLLFHFQNSLPSLHIEDGPRYAWRGCMLDCARHFFPSRFIRKWIRMLALLKINILHWHFCDDQGWRIQLPQYPHLSEYAAWRQEAAGYYGGYYSPDEVRDIVTYARQYGITVVPELEMPGHTAAVLAAYPHLATAKLYQSVPTTWGIFEDGYNIANPNVRNFLKSLIDELIPLFPSPYFHIGGDETPDKVWNSHKGSWETVKALKKDFYTDITTHLKNRGKQAVGWDEAAESDIPDLLWTMVWRDSDYIPSLLEKGYTLILAPQNRGAYLDWRQSDTPREPGRSWGISDPQTIFTQSSPFLSQIHGMEATIWTEGMRSEWEVEYMAFPRLLILSQHFWQPDHSLNWAQMQSLIHQYIPLLNDAEIYYHPFEEPNNTADHIFTLKHRKHYEIKS